jgi:hypothetical protein
MPMQIDANGNDPISIMMDLFGFVFAKYQLSDGSPPLVSIDENVKFPLNIQYFL